MLCLRAASVVQYGASKLLLRKVWNFETMRVFS